MASHLQTSRTNINRLGHVIALVFILCLSLIIASCGSNESSQSAVLQGGAIQGIPLQLTGDVSTLAGKFLDSPDGTGLDAVFSDPDGITAIGNDLYVADSESFTIRKVSLLTGEVTTVAGKKGVSASVDGSRDQASFQGLNALATDGQRLYVADFGSIRQVDVNTGAVVTIADKSPLFNDPGWNEFYPKGLTIIGSALYIIQGQSQIVSKLDLETREMSMVAGTRYAPHAVDGAGETASFFSLNGIATDGKDIYVTDGMAVRKIEVATKKVTTITGYPGIFSPDYESFLDGDVANARFGPLKSIVINGKTIYLGDVYNRVIRKIDLAAGVVSTVAGNRVADYDVPVADGVGTNASFEFIRGAAIIGQNIFVSDGNKIRRINSTTTEVTTISGGEGNASDKDGAGSHAGFRSPSGMTTDGFNLYVADYGNSVIRKVVIATGEVTTLAGKSGVRGFDDGVGPNATFSHPWAITSDSTFLYVCDLGTSRIRKVEIATGSVSTLAGQAGIGMADGPASIARFDAPWAITTDGKNLYISELNNRRIRKLELATGIVSTIVMEDSISGLGVTYFSPRSICTDGRSLYIEFYGIWKLSLETGKLSRSMVPGTEMTSLMWLTTDGENLYLATTNHVIQKVNLRTGRNNTIAGIPGQWGTSNGVGSNALFYTPMGITTDGKSLFISDRSNNVIRKIN